MLMRFRNVKVSGMSLVLPPNTISIYDELQYYGNSEKKAERAHMMAGFWKRRVADRNVTAADMGVQAAENLLSKIDVAKEDINAMVFVVQMPDYGGPVTSYLVHHRLGLSKDCYVTDVTQGCVGWCFGLLTAFQMVSSGTFKRVLLINADTPAYNIKHEDRINAPLFGDAAVATMVEFDETATETTFNLETFSAGWDAIVCPGSGRRLGLDLRNEDDWRTLTSTFNTCNGRVACLGEGYMDGAAVFEFSTQKAPENIKALMAACGTSVETYDKVYLHQANKQIIQAVGCNAGFPLEKIPYSGFENFGNNTMCSIPSTLLYEKADDLRTASGTRVICSGFGNGLVVCSIDMTLANLRCAEINDYRHPEDALSNADWVAHWRDKFANT
jgi:3-oxoacyl-[acyl-carrier-protein] synthase III